MNVKLLFSLGKYNNTIIKKPLITNHFINFKMNYKT